MVIKIKKRKEKREVARRKRETFYIFHGVSISTANIQLRNCTDTIDLFLVGPVTPLFFLFFSFFFFFVCFFISFITSSLLLLFFPLLYIATICHSNNNSERNNIEQTKRRISIVCNGTYVHISHIQT